MECKRFVERTSQWSKGWERRIDSFWNSSILSFLLIVTFLGLLVYWFIVKPSPGKAVTALAVAAAVMAFRPEIGGLQKSFWMVVFFGLLLIENRAIDHDRIEGQRQLNRDRLNTQRATRSILKENRDATKHILEQNEEHFKKFLDDSQVTRDQQTKQFAALLREEEDIFANQRASFNDTKDQLTGGDSYLYLDTSEPFAVGSDEIMCNAFPHVVGKYPLHNVFVSVFEPMGWLPDIDYGTFFPGELGRTRQGAALSWKSDVPLERIQMFINASNGSYSETILFSKGGDKWLKAIVLSNTTKEGVRLYQHIDPGFPVGATGQPQW